MQWLLNGVKWRSITIAAVLGVAALGAAFGAGYLLGGRQEARIQIKEVEKKVTEYVEVVREVQVRNYEVERELQERLRRSAQVAASLQDRLDNITYPDTCTPNLDVVRVLNEAVADHPGTDAASIPDAEIGALTVRDVDRHHLEVIARYNHLALRHDTLVDWVERELIKNDVR